MITSGYRKVGLISCMILALVAGVLPQLARAQTTGTTNLTTAAQNALSTLNTTGSSAIPGLANQLNLQSIAPSAQNLANITQTLTALSSGQNINPANATALLSGVMGGQIPGQLGAALAALPSLGNINSVQGLQAALQQPSIQNLIANSPLANQGALITNAIGLIGNAQALQQLANPANALAFANSLATTFPSVFGGLNINTLTSQVQTLATNFLTQIGLPGGLAGAIAGGALAGVLGSITGAITPVPATPVVRGTCGSCCSSCGVLIPQDYTLVRNTITSEFAVHQQWFLTTYWLDNILPALMLMAEQLTVTGVHQVEIIGTMLDAKHQLETQRLFQELTAQAHKDYQPSEGMCTFGSAVKSLVSSERLSNLVQVGLAQRMNQRQLMSGNVVSNESEDSDIRSRMKKFTSTYCDQADNTNGLTQFCPTPTPTPARRNIDINYTKNIESRLTLDVDLTAGGAPTADQEDLFALSANLFAHNIAPKIDPNKLGGPNNQVRQSAIEKYMDLRAIYAKRSVAQNSFAAITAMRANGDIASAPYTKRLIQELGITNPTDIDNILGVRPSYFAQMEVLTKKLYQNPTFYTELYDKPTNVERKGAALQAIGLMQDRDLFNSLVRSEAVLSVLLETMLEKEQNKIINAGRKMYGAGGSN